MMSEGELWIGDKVRLKKSGRIGKYEGKKSNGKHKVRLGYKYVITALSNLERIDESDTIHPTSTNRKVTLDKTTTYASNTLDLHIEKLKPSLLHANPIRIRDYQIATAEKFLTYAYDKKWYEITIIHGRGNGVLRSEIHHMARISPFVYNYHLINNDGATHILLKRMH